MNKCDFRLTSVAIEKVRERLQERNTPDAALRIGIRGGLCNGYGYHLEFCDEPASERDIVFDFGGVRVYIDKKSITFLNGAQLDWKKSLVSQGFEFDNPNAQSQCGCKKSFSM